ncbi:hypothetical protein BC628DRAFT_60663 [Trametes gibbosa]|nr:hypothetical protein BC628DRAFT_60663 [Trametes gibbosa]
MLCDSALSAQPPPALLRLVCCDHSLVVAHLWALMGSGRPREEGEGNWRRAFLDLSRPRGRADIVTYDVPEARLYPAFLPSMGRRCQCRLVFRSLHVVSNSGHIGRKRPGRHRKPTNLSVYLSICDSAINSTDWVSGSEPASEPGCRQESSSDVVPSLFRTGTAGIGVVTVKQL